MGKQWLSRRAAQLPAVLHDAALRTLTIDYTSHRATFGLDLCVGDPRANTDAEREAYRPVTLTISGLLWCVIECPESGANMGEGLWIDAGPLTASSKGQTCPAWRTGLRVVDFRPPVERVYLCGRTYCFDRMIEQPASEIRPKRKPD